MPVWRNQVAETASCSRNQLINLNAVELTLTFKGCNFNRLFQSGASLRREWERWTGGVGFFSKSKNVVGLDIGSPAVKLVELKEKKGGPFQLVKLGIERLSPEAIVDGSIMDSSLVVETISRLNTEKAVKNSHYAPPLSGHSVIIKKITLPAMSPEELAESIQWEAEQYIPFDINDVNLDYVPLNTPGAGDNIDVILVAVKKEKINDYTSVISQTGKVPVLVDVDAFALQNAYEMNYTIDHQKGLGPATAVAPART